MATHGRGGVRRLLLRVKKMWRQVIRRKSIRHSEEAMKVHIPNDIVLEILSRLPATSLLRLRWACKYWFDLITRDDYFIKMHLHHSTTCDNEILSIISTSKRSISCLNFDYSKNDTFGYHVSSELNDPLGFHQPKILGSCNGLILLSENGLKKLCILNPCTKEYRILPNPLSVMDIQPLAENYGFGYDHRIDDYKVIRKTYYFYDNNTHSDFEVYTLGTNSWRMIELKRNRRSFMETVFVNGFIYWMDNLQYHINSFDIEKEEQFQNVPKIPKIANRYWYNMELIVFEGSLCAIVKIKDQQVYRVEMWVMKDYTMNNNDNDEMLWTKLSTIPDLQDYEFPVKPIRYTRNGEILVLSNHTDLYLYDPKNKKDRTALGKISEFPNDHDLVQEIYIGSLVSLNSGTYAGQDEGKKKNNNKKKMR